MRWAVVVASPSGADGEQWGDTWFGRDLVDALNRQGQAASLVYRGGASSEARDKDDVVAQRHRSEATISGVATDMPLDGGPNPRGI